MGYISLRQDTNSPATSVNFLFTFAMDQPENRNLDPASSPQTGEKGLKRKGL
jgi:hypothetical protein